MLRGVMMALLLCVMGFSPVWGQTTTVTAATATASTADEMLRYAAYLASVSDFSRARDVYYGVLEQFPGTTAVDKAVVGIAKTYLGEQDYRRAVAYLEDVLVKSADMAARTEARQLYTTLEQTFRKARTTADSQVQAKQAEYDDISWFNIFKLFTKLRLRSELKTAKKELAQISEIHNLFNPRLLIPAEMGTAGTPATTTSGTTTTSTATASASPSPSPTASSTTSTTQDMDRARAYEILKDEIAALIALIPQEKLTETAATAAAATAAASPTPEASPAASPEASPVPSPEPSPEASPEAAAAPSTTTTSESTAETPTTTEGKPGETVVIGETSKPETTSTTSTASTGTTTETTATVVAEPSPSPTPTVTTAQSLGELRSAYMAAYRRYAQALRANNREEAMAALREYQASMRAFQAAHVQMMRNRNSLPADSRGGARESTTSGPSAPGDSGSTASPSASPSPAASQVQGQAGRPYYGPQGNISVDQGGRAVPHTASTIRGSRQSLQH